MGNSNIFELAREEREKNKVKLIVNQKNKRNDKNKWKYIFIAVSKTFIVRLFKAIDH